FHVTGVQTCALPIFPLPVQPGHPPPPASYGHGDATQKRCPPPCPPRPGRWPYRFPGAVPPRLQPRCGRKVPFFPWSSPPYRRKSVHIVPKTGGEEPPQRILRDDKAV